MTSSGSKCKKKKGEREWGKKKNVQHEWTKIDVVDASGCKVEHII